MSTSAGTKSKLPPRTRAKLDRLYGTDFSVYVQELIGAYEVKINRLNTYGADIWAEWVSAEVKHLKGCLAEIQIEYDKVMKR